MSVDGSKQGYAPCIIVCTTKHLFVSLNFNGDYKTVIKINQNLSTTNVGIIQDL